MKMNSPFEESPRKTTTTGDLSGVPWNTFNNDFTPCKHPVGIYGWRKKCIHLMFILLTVMVIANVAILVWIIGVMNLTVKYANKNSCNQFEKCYNITDVQKDPVIPESQQKSCSKYKCGRSCELDNFDVINHKDMSGNDISVSFLPPVGKIENLEKCMDLCMAEKWQFCKSVVYYHPWLKCILKDRKEVHLLHFLKEAIHASRTCLCESITC